MIGGVLRMYMVIRTRGWRGYFSSQSAAIQDYRLLVSKHQAPSWPIPLSYLCAVGGIVTIFGSIIFSPK
jgi:hypothetical protein